MGPTTHFVPLLNSQVIADYTGLENFWKRYNKVKLEQLSLQHRRAQLLEINRKLREMLKQYLDGISVSDEVLSQLNPLFVVNHRSNLPQSLSLPTTQPGDKKPPTTYNIIEAAHVIPHILWYKPKNLFNPQRIFRETWVLRY